MDAVEFFKTVNRLCKNQSCEECPVYKNDMCCMVGFTDNAIKNIEETISKVEQWAKEHPVKTRQSEFLKQFPNATLYRDVISIPPCIMEKEIRENCLKSDCYECRRDYWLTEITDND